MRNGYSQALARQPGSHRSWNLVEAFKRSLIDNLYYKCGQGAHTASENDIYMALAYTVRDSLTERFHLTANRYAEQLPKFVYYLSAEYLPGRQINQNLLYTGGIEAARQALAELGFDLDKLIELEPEPALGNGGLGRLAACICDSLATLNIPSVAYGIHYEFGIFEQSFKDGWQIESPDNWLYYGNPWEFSQTDNRVTVGFGGHTEYSQDENGRLRVRWLPAETVFGEPYHTLVPGYKTDTVNLLRLWRAKASKEFDLQFFEVGDYIRAAEQKILSENISKVLYPSDETLQGKELRLRQEYFFCACSISDILRRYLSFEPDFTRFKEKVVIHINDTHPAVAIPELMRLLMDVHGLEWEPAWDLTSHVFAYTCHTLMPEALEKWPVYLFGRLLPRHLEIIYEINRRFLEQVQTRFPNDPARLARMSIIEEQPERMIRMAYLAAIGCFSINGVAQLHSDLLKRLVFPDFYEMWPEKFSNKTNGVSPRRFMLLANPRLSQLITNTIGPGWETNLQQLENLEKHVDDPAFRQDWREVKRQNKVELARIVLERTGIVVNPDSMFDVMVKRLHEYKRQLLQALHIITLYQRIQANPNLDIVPRTFLFGGKAAPGYHMAKLVIKLINSIAEVINADPLVEDRIKVVFMPNFNVTLGEKIYPAADLSEQISLAGKEASGTGNMKFVLNGAVIIGTLDGANIEIRERVGPENFFSFGLTAEEVLAYRNKGYNPLDVYYQNAELKQAIDSIADGTFSRGVREIFRPIVDALLYRDEYMLLADYPSFLQAQSEVDRAYRDREAWTRRSILNTARCGYFSSDRTVLEYCADIWKVAPVK